MYTPINEKQEYCNNYDINDINFCVDQLGDSVFSLEEGKGRQLEICYKYENSVSIDILKSRNTILFNNKTEIISMTVLPSNHRICMDFSLKINL